MLRDREWRAELLAARRALSRQLTLIEHDAELEVRDEDDRVLDDVRLDVDFWTDGALARLRGDVEAALAALGEGELPMDVAGLRDVVERRAPEFEERLLDLVEQARLEQLASQVRVNLADAVVETLDHRGGYVFVDGTYSGDDQRQAFFAKLVHQDGSEIVVDVSPEAPGSGGCVLRLLSYDRGHASEEDRVDRARAIAVELRGQGLDVDEPEAEPGEPDPEYRDLEAIRHRELPRAANRS